MIRISVDQAHIRKAQALDSLADNTVVFYSAFNAEIVKPRIFPGAVDQEAAFSAADFARNRVGIAKNFLPQRVFLELTQANFYIHMRIWGGFSDVGNLT